MEHALIDRRSHALFDSYFTPPMHAYILCAPRGALKRDFALYAAKRLLCTGEGNDICGECPSCRMFEAFASHPCLTVIRRSKDKASIPVEDIRAIRDELYESPYLGPYRIYIIEEAERLTVNAQNALLKMLEEPPEYAVFILTAARREGVLPTVASRCMVLSVPQFSRRDTAEIIRSVLPEESRDKTELFSGLCGGCPGILDDLLDDGYAELRALAVKTLAGLVKGTGAGDVYTVSSRFSQKGQREDAVTFLQIISSFIADAAAYAVRGEGHEPINCDNIALIGDIAASCHLKKLTDYVMLLEDCMRKLQSNVNVSLAVESALLSWWQ